MGGESGLFIYFFYLELGIYSFTSFFSLSSIDRWINRIEETYITILHPCNTQHDNGEKTSYTNDNAISGCWRQDSKAMVEFLLLLLLFGHVFFGWLTD